VDEHSELENILSSLRESFNPNYQDMGVLAAVRAYEKIAGLPHINDVRNAADEVDGTVVKTEEEEGAIPAEENVEDGKERLWNATELEEKLDDLIKSDTESLLLEHDKHAASPAGGSGDSLRMFQMDI
jgi:protein kinase C substrate 80K-H